MEYKLVISLLLTNTNLVLNAAAGSVDTAIGPISTDMGGFVSAFARIAIGIGGVAAVGLLAYGAFTLLTSAGDPEKIMTGREIITNAIVGLILIILALFVLELLGWGILGIGDLIGVPFSDIGTTP